MNKGPAHTRHVIMLTVLLAAAPVLTGAPMPSLRVEVWERLPQNAAIRIELQTIMMPMPGDLTTRLKVVKDSKPVPGRWTVDNQVQIACGSRLRLAFSPTAPLAPGSYEVRGIPEQNLDPVRRRWQTVTVAASRDTDPPGFAGLRGAYCMRPNPLLGCRPHGIGLRAHEATDASRVRLVTTSARAASPTPPPPGWTRSCCPTQPSASPARSGRAATS